MAVRARLGDKDAEQKLIEKYNEEQYYHNKKILVKELFRAGTDACLKNLIIRFNEPMYDIVQNNCVNESIRYPIIQGFRRMHPEDSLFKEPFRCVDTLRFPKPDMVNSFLEQFKEWAYKKYQVKPEGSEPEPVLLKNFCDGDSGSDRSKCLSLKILRLKKPPFLALNTCFQAPKDSYKDQSLLVPVV